MSLPRSHLPLKWMQNFKAVAIDYEYYLTLSDKPQTVCMTERQAYVLSVQNTYTYWLTRWYNTDDITKKTVEFIAAEIEGVLTLCQCGVPIPSITDIINSNSYTTNTSNEYVTNNTTYTADGDTLTTLAPNMVGASNDIDRVLCFGYEMALKAIIEQGKAINSGTAEQSQNLVQQIGTAMSALAAAGTLALTVGGFAATVVAVIGGPWALLGLALGGIATGIASLFITADQSLFDDAEAIELVLCTMRTNSEGNSPTFDVFNNLLEPNEFAVGGNAEKLAAMVQPFLDDLSFYLQFMVSMSDLYNTPLLVALPECVTCPLPPDPNCVDLSSNQDGWAPTTPGYGVYLSGLAPQQDAGRLFSWFKSGTGYVGSVNSITFTFNEAVTSFIFRRSNNATVYTYSGSPTMMITINNTVAPGQFPYPLTNGWRITFPSNQAPTQTFRVIEICNIP